MGTKLEMTKAVSKSANITTQQANAAVESMIEYIKTSLIEEAKPLCIRGFGTFSTDIRAARTAHDPRTGRIIECEMKKVIKFRPHSGLKASVQNRFAERMKAAEEYQAKRSQK